MPSNSSWMASIVVIEGSPKIEALFWKQKTAYFWASRAHSQATPQNRLIATS